MPEHRLRLAPHNPGQFFACCGLFELSELAAPGGEAWFAEEGQKFVISTEARVPPAALSLVPRADEQGHPTDLGLEPLLLKVGDRALALNWWLNETFTDKSRLKTHGGPQKPREMLAKLLELLDPETPPEGVLQVSEFTTTRFGLDARSAWEAIDFGYSPNDEVLKNARTFPWVEVLAAAGLQGFRPREESRSQYRYSAWLTPLSLAAARAACACPWGGLPTRSFCFEIAVRGQGYKTFLFAEGADDVRTTLPL